MLEARALGLIVMFCRPLYSYSALATTSCRRCLSLMRAAATRSLLSPENQADSSRIYLLNQHTPDELSVSDALRALRAYSIADRPETVEISLRVDMSMKKNKVRDPFRGTLIYPHRFGTEQKILVFVEGALANAARTAGADIVGGEELISKVENGDVTFDLCMCTPAMFDKITLLQRKLRAKMPNPRRGTVTDDITQAIVRFKQSREYKCDKHGYLNMPVGKLDFPDNHIDANIKSLVDTVNTHREHLSKSLFIKRAVLSSTYGPGFMIRFR